MIKKFFTKIITGLVVILGISTTQVNADYSGFINQLNSMGIETQYLASKAAFSRYDITQLINAVECQDCMNTPVWMQERYIGTFWDSFINLPGKDFDDITYLGGIQNNQSYYYCVAYVGDNNFMRGYPSEVSPICGGYFCGSRTTTVAEFIQVLINILSQHIYNQYSVKREDIKTWLTTIKKGGSADLYLLKEDRTTIEQQAQKCGTSTCPIINAGAFKTYLKYCMFNLEKCNMRTFGNITQAVWPVAELNIITQQNIIDSYSLNIDKIHDPIKGNIVFNALYKLYEIIKCDFNNDYDCDSLDNAKDDCPNRYNPTQVDTDGDGMGDVCDPDIDNDGVLNPVGIVNDLGRINISVADPKMDNCLLVKNPTQKITKSKFIGDACEVLSDKVGIYINIKEIVGSAPLTLDLEAVTKGTLSKVTRLLEEGVTKEGSKIKYTFQKPGDYVVKATAKGPNNETQAQASIIIGEGSDSQNTLAIRTDKAGGRIGTEIKFWVSSAGNPDRIERDFGDSTRTIEKAADQSINKTYSKEGQFFVKAKAWKGSKLISVAMTTVGIGAKKGIVMQSTKSLPEQGQSLNLQTLNQYQLNQNDISYVEWDFGDGQKTKNNSLAISHSFSRGGSKVISQKIMLKDGSFTTNYMTIYVIDPILANSYSMIVKPDDLRRKKGQESKFSMNVVGSTVKNPLLLSYQHIPGMTQRVFSLNTRPILSSNYSHFQEGIAYPQAILNVNKCQTLQTQAAVVIQGLDSCLEALLKGELSQFKCDMDKDGNPDMCDNDIDGDGIENLVGILTHENADCSINEGNIDINVLGMHLKGVCTLDSCPFSTNQDQLDLNKNMIGDVCDANIANIIKKSDGGLIKNAFGEKDQDGDGIEDSMDACPAIPESYNGTSDLDGCPEIGIEFDCPNYGVLPLCGNKKIDVGETCDDGNIVDDDSCSNSCFLNTAPGPKCPEGLTLCPDNICRTFCGGYKCGNSIKEGTEQCDDGNNIETDNCSNKCLITSTNGPKCPEGLTLCPDNICRTFCSLGGTGDDNGGGGNRCGDSSKCEATDGCECPECDLQNPSCQTNLSCSSQYGICCDQIGNGVCFEGCRDVDPDCTDDIECGNPNVCEEKDGCQCAECDQQNPSCDPNLACSSEYGLCCDRIGNGRCNQACLKVDPDCTNNCGNGTIDPGETCITCPSDVGVCPGGCTDIICIEACNKCPCQYADFMSSLSDGDKIKTILRDLKKSSLYNFSAIVGIPYVK